MIFVSLFILFALVSSISFAGQKAYNFMAKDYADRQVNMKDFKGKVVAIFFGSKNTEAFAEPMIVTLMYMFRKQPNYSTITIGQFSTFPPQMHAKLIANDKEMIVPLIRKHFHEKQQKAKEKPWTDKQIFSKGYLIADTDGSIAQGFGLNAAEIQNTLITVIVDKNGDITSVIKGFNKIPEIVTAINRALK